MDFFKEFQALRDKTPRLALRVTQCTNSDYTNFSHGNKNCYLITGAGGNEDCYYGTTMISNKDCIDSHTVFDSELCYECVDCENCYNLNFSQDCKQSRDSWFLFDCIGCNHCFGCVSQRHKSYMFFNKQLTKEAYEEEIKKFLTPESMKEAKNLFQELQKKSPRIYSRQINCENSVGDHLTNCKNCFVCYDGREVEDCLYCDRPLFAKDCVDCSYLYKNCELNYMVMSAISITNVNFSYMIDFSHDCEYCINVFNSHHLFGCVSRNHAEYEILNQKYEPDEWHKRVAEIKAEMRASGTYGKMFESDYPFSDSVATDFFKPPKKL